MTAIIISAILAGILVIAVATLTEITALSFLAAMIILCIITRLIIAIAERRHVLVATYNNEKYYAKFSGIHDNLYPGFSFLGINKKPFRLRPCIVDTEQKTVRLTERNVFIMVNGTDVDGFNWLKGYKLLYGYENAKDTKDTEK